MVFPVEQEGVRDHEKIWKYMFKLGSNMCCPVKCFKRGWEKIRKSKNGLAADAPWTRTKLEMEFSFLSSFNAFTRGVNSCLCTHPSPSLKILFYYGHNKSQLQTYYIHSTINRHQGISIISYPSCIVFITKYDTNTVKQIINSENVLTYPVGRSSPSPFLYNASFLRILTHLQPTTWE